MPQGTGQKFMNLISWLLFLSVIGIWNIQGQSTVLPVAHDAIYASAATHHDGKVDAMALLRGDHYTGSPCKGPHGAHGLACCFSSGCSMMSGWLSVPATVLPRVMPGTLVYVDLSPLGSDGLQFAPMLPPPRSVV
jgi:hypothetical protein